VLLVTGPITKNLLEALERTAEAAPDPKWIVGVGDCASDGGVFKGGYAVLGGLGADADLLIPGCPPTPVQILTGLCSLLDVNSGAKPARREPHGRA
jgi:Ni,Fe-hydrogenase III small subunit